MKHNFLLLAIGLLLVLQTLPATAHRAAIDDEDEIAPVI